MFLLTTGIDLSYKINFFPENLKNKVKRLLKSEVKNHSCRETYKSVEVSSVKKISGFKKKDPDSVPAGS